MHNQLLINKPSHLGFGGGEYETKSMLENVIYNPQNYAINSNYRREFDHKRKSEGQNTINQIRSQHG